MKETEKGNGKVQRAAEVSNVVSENCWFVWVCIHLLIQ